MMCCFKYDKYDAHKNLFLAVKTVISIALTFQKFTITLIQ